MALTHQTLAHKIAADVRVAVMKTRAMIFGMLPLAFEIGGDSEFCAPRAPMAPALIGGLITPT